MLQPTKELVRSLDDRPLLDEELYPSGILRRRKHIRRFGSFREKVAFNCLARPAYAFGLLAAADLAAYFGYVAVSAIEFGVGEGAGLKHLCSHAQEVQRATGIEVQVYGFDSFEGIPPPIDFRDHPEIWSAGDFANGAKEGLKASLGRMATIVEGQLADVVPSFAPAPGVPIGFVAIDVDTYSSTRDALALFAGKASDFTPTVITYFDDIFGSGARLSSLMRNSRCGQMAAIEEFNESHDVRVVDPLHVVRHRVVFDREPWLERLYAAHILDHPDRSKVRAPLTLDEWAGQENLTWHIR